MAGPITNYDGSITVVPQQLVYPETVEELQAILRDSARYPSPVRAMGSFHSLTPCVATVGTVVNMGRMARVIRIDKENLTLTAQAGLEIVDAAKALREQGLQMMLNIEIGNMTLGSAACCHTKDALDGIEFGQVSSYVTGMKWVTPQGELGEASEENHPELLHVMRSSYGLCGVIYEVTLRIKPLEALHLTYLPRPVDELTEAEVSRILDDSEGLICWTVGRTAVFQQRHRVTDTRILGSLEAAVRRRLWSYEEAHVGHFIDQFLTDKTLRDAAEQGNVDVTKLLYGTLHLFGGITVLAPDKIIDYHNTPANARYAFTFWAFPRARWLETLQAYVDFAEEYFKATGFRCNMPLGAYRVRRDGSSLLSYSMDGDMFSIDPIHASTNDVEWHGFLRAFNAFAYQRKGVPLLNQSPFVEREHVEAAYGERWLEFSAAVRKMDPGGRMLNPFFADLLSPASA